MDTFLVRVWTEAEPASDLTSTARQPGDVRSLNGMARHVRTGLETRFSTPAELLAFLETGPRQGSAGATIAVGPGVAIERVTVETPE
jgi:hypothetical protein